jgi:hypothetical protein
MLPMSFFAKRVSFAVTNVVSLAMYFGMFGSIFFLSQFLQNVLGNTPAAGRLKLLVWTGATMVVAPLAGFFSERYGSRLFMVAGLGLQAIALAGWRRSPASHELREHARPVHPRRRRHGARVRARRPTRCSPRCGPTRPARPRAPPTRSASSAACSASRCSRRVHQPRRLRLAAGVRQRPRPGDVGRRRGARRRRADRCRCRSARRSKRVRSRRAVGARSAAPTRPADGAPSNRSSAATLAAVSAGPRIAT